MTNVTNCPNCETQFIVTDEQLSQYNGKVRCGNCLHVFDATQQLVDVNESADAPVTPEVSENLQDIDDSVPHENATKNDEVIETVSKSFIHDSQTSYFQKLDSKKQSKSRLYKWLISLFALALLIAAVLQSIYFWRTEISIYYPKLKPLLEQTCKTIGCAIELPKKIEFIIIDDSDMQEDADHDGLIHFSSTLINQAGFIQTYPNIELTLTDLEDKPKLRRIFKPTEYLPENMDIVSGLAAGAEVKVKLALTTTGESVAGYRISVSY